jgi:hypothetical protein
MLESPETNWTALQWEGKNELWDEVINTLDAFIDADVQSATEAELSAGERAFHCGGAASLCHFKEHLLAAREMAIGRKAGE